MTVLWANIIIYLFTNYFTVNYTDSRKISVLQSTHPAWICVL